MTKNEFMLKGSDERLNTLTAFPVAMNSSWVKQVATTKSLGVTINVKLGWNYQGKGVLRISSDGDDRMGAKKSTPPQKKMPRDVCFFIILAELVIRGNYHEPSDCFERCAQFARILLNSFVRQGLNIKSHRLWI